MVQHCCWICYAIVLDDFLLSDTRKINKSLQAAYLHPDMTVLFIGVGSVGKSLGLAVGGLESLLLPLSLVPLSS